MAAAGEEEVEYESDPEEAKRLLRMRRREASDDEEEEERERPLRRIDSRAAIGSDGESDGQGAAAEYDDEESEIEEEELEVEEEEEEEEVEADVVEEGDHEVRGGKDSVEIGGEDEKELDGDGRRSVGESMELLQGVNQVEEEKKENEPFAVPTAGAFYMHDDRFRDSAGGGQHSGNFEYKETSPNRERFTAADGAGVSSPCFSPLRHRGNRRTTTTPPTFKPPPKISISVSASVHTRQSVPATEQTKSEAQP